ncbi:MAG: hypothetical protein OXG37_04625 [Actinomycetia bacterium]|nr:hypothetical protein [Actinomycetes bacterium]
MGSPSTTIEYSIPLRFLSCWPVAWFWSVSRLMLTMMSWRRFSTLGISRRKVIRPAPSSPTLTAVMSGTQEARSPSGSVHDDFGFGGGGGALPALTS